MTTQLSIPANALKILNTEPVTALCLRTTTTLKALKKTSGSIAEKLYSEAYRLNLKITGPANWMYTDANGDENHEFQLTIALPIQQPGALSTEFTYETVRQFRCASYTHKGPWSDFMALYGLLFEQFCQLGYTNDGRVREIYSRVDFNVPGNCVTEIQIAIAD